MKLKTNFNYSPSIFLTVALVLVTLNSCKIDANFPKVKKLTSYQKTEFVPTLEHNISLGYTKNGYVSDTDYLQFIQNIFSTIISKNSSYKINSPKYYITKSNIPNASSLGFDFYTIVKFVKTI